MILWKKALFTGSILLLLFFIYSIVKINTAKYKSETNMLTFFDTDMSKQSYKVDYKSLTKNMNNNLAPFKPKLFENIKFKGLLKNKNNLWVALFQTQDDKIVRLGQGESYESVMVKYTDKHTCLVQVGKTTHRFDIR